MTYTFSDGLTLAASNVTNDLVTGEEVAQVDALTAGGARFRMFPSGEVSLASAEDQGLGIQAGLGMTLASLGGLMEITAASANGVLIHAGGDATIEAGQDEIHTVVRDETHTIGRNLVMQMAGAAGSSIDAQNGNLSLHAGSTDGTGEVRIQPTAGAPDATRTVRFFNGAGTSQITIDTGVSDSFTIGQICDLLFALGLITNPSP